MSYTVVPVPQASDEFAAVVRHINPKRDITIHRISAVKHASTPERVRSHTTAICTEEGRNIDFVAAGDIPTALFDYMRISPTTFLDRIYDPDDAFLDIVDYTYRPTLDLVGENYHHKFDGSFPPDIDTATKYTILFGHLPPFSGKAAVLPLYIVYFTDEELVVPEKRAFHDYGLFGESSDVRGELFFVECVQSDNWMFSVIRNQLRRCFISLFGHDRTFADHAVQQLSSEIYRGAMSGDQAATQVYLLRREPMSECQYESLCTAVELFHRGKVVASKPDYARILDLAVLPVVDDSTTRNLTRILSCCLAAVLFEHRDDIEAHLHDPAVDTALFLLEKITSTDDSIVSVVSVAHQLLESIAHWKGVVCPHIDIPANCIISMVNTVLWMMKCIRGPCSAGPAIRRQGYTIPECLDRWLDMLSLVDGIRAIGTQRVKTMNERLISWSINRESHALVPMRTASPTEYVVYLAVHFNMVLPDIDTELGNILKYVIHD